MNPMTLPDPHTVPLAQMDVSDPRLYEQDAWRPWFARLREEAPVHYLADTAYITEPGDTPANQPYAPVIAEGGIPRLSRKIQEI